MTRYGFFPQHDLAQGWAQNQFLVYEVALGVRSGRVFQDMFLILEQDRFGAGGILGHGLMSNQASEPNWPISKQHFQRIRLAEKGFPAPK